MSPARRPWKLWVQAGLALLLAADAGLAIARWRIGETASQQQLQLRVVQLRAEAAALRSNLNRAEKVRREIPQVAQECERFYEQELLGRSQGYLALVSDLDAIASKAGLAPLGGVNFDQRNGAQHGVTEVDASAVIEGNYDELIRFINGLERSSNFYVLDSLELASSTAGQAKLNIHLHTYFRT